MLLFICRPSQLLVSLPSRGICVILDKWDLCPAVDWWSFRPLAFLCWQFACYDVCFSWKSRVIWLSGHVAVSPSMLAGFGFNFLSVFVISHMVDAGPHFLIPCTQVLFARRPLVWLTVTGGFLILFLPCSELGARFEIEPCHVGSSGICFHYHAWTFWVSLVL